MGIKSFRYIVKPHGKTPLVTNSLEKAKKECDFYASLRAPVPCHVFDHESLQIVYRTDRAGESEGR